jgi:hypothetical protein
MAPTLKGIKNAFGKFAHKFRRRTKKPTTTLQPSTFRRPISTHPEKFKHENAVALLEQLKLSTARYQNLFDTEDKIRTSAHLKSMKLLTDELNMKQQGCEHDLSIVVDENAKKQDEINELKHEITNYEAIVADSNKINRELQDELAQCQGSKSRKLGSSGRLQNTSSRGRQHTGLTSTGPTSSSINRSVKSGSRRSSNLIRSRKQKLKTIHELNKSTESSSKRRARIAKQNNMVSNAGMFINTHKKAIQEILDAKKAAVEKAAANQAAANAKKAAATALSHQIFAYRGTIRRGG